jgi:hypothetical protein
VGQISGQIVPQPAGCHIPCNRCPTRQPAALSEAGKGASKVQHSKADRIPNIAHTVLLGAKLWLLLVAFPALLP